MVQEHRDIFILNLTLEICVRTWKYAGIRVSFFYLNIHSTLNDKNYF